MDQPQGDDTFEDTSQSGTSEVQGQLQDFMIDLQSTDPSVPIEDTGSFSNSLASASIVGLGEATHGSRAIFQLKHRFVRLLVEEYGFRLFGLEANFSETLQINEYILHGNGDPREALDGLHIWPWNIDSFLGMIEWMREFNTNRPVSDRIKCYGFDAQYTAGPIRALSSFLQDTVPEFLEAVEDDLRLLNDEGIPPHQDDILDERLAAAKRVIPELRTLFENDLDTCSEDSDSQTIRLARHQLTVLNQAIGHKRTMRDRQTVENPTIPLINRSLWIRDRSMTENVRWILQHEDHHRMVMWGHNGHLNRIEHRSRDTDARATSLGGHLSDCYGRDYYAVSFTFGRGRVLAVGPDPELDENGYRLRAFEVDQPPKNSIERTLTDEPHDVAFIDLRSATNNKTNREWVNTPQRQMSIGAVYDPENSEKYVTEYPLGKAFDGLCFVRESMPSRHLPSE